MRNRQLSQHTHPSLGRSRLCLAPKGLRKVAGDLIPGQRILSSLTPWRGAGHRVHIRSPGFLPSRAPTGAQQGAVAPRAGGHTTGYFLLPLRGPPALLSPLFTKKTSPSKPLSRIGEGKKKVGQALPALIATGTLHTSHYSDNPALPI